MSQVNRTPSFSEFASDDPQPPHRGYVTGEPIISRSSSYGALPPSPAIDLEIPARRGRATTVIISPSTISTDLEEARPGRSASFLKVPQSALDLEVARLRARALTLSPEKPNDDNDFPELFKDHAITVDPMETFDANYAESMEWVTKALRAMEPQIKSAEPKSAMSSPFREEESEIILRLKQKLQHVEDPVVVHEHILQAKVLLYNNWLQELRRLSQFSYPECSDSVKFMNEAFRNLFRDYPGFVSLDDLDIADNVDMVEIPDGNVMSVRSELADVVDDEDKVPMERARSATNAFSPVRGRTRTIVPPPPVKPSLRSRLPGKLKQWLFMFFPILLWLPNYHRLQLPRSERNTKTMNREEKMRAVLRNLLHDLLSGLTVGVVAIPQGLAYARLADLPPVTGLYTAMVQCCIYVIFGTCHQAHVGPVALGALLTHAAIHSQFGDIHPSLAQRAMIASALAFMVGIIYLGLGLLRLGFVVNFLSGPVLSGFTSAAAFIIICSQLGPLFGLPPFEPGEIAWKALYETCIRLHLTNYSAFLVGISMLALIMFLKNSSPTIPAALIAVVIGTAVSGSLNLTVTRGVPVIGYITPGLPGASIPPVWYFGLMFKDAIVIALIMFMESISVSKKSSQFFDYDISPNQELVALGCCNIFSCFFGGFPGVGCFGRTAVAMGTQARSLIYSVISAIVLIIVLTSLTSLFYHLPTSVLAAVVMSGVWSLIDFKIFLALWRESRFDFLALTASFLATLAAGADLGILIAIGFSFALTMYQASRPHTCVLGRVPGNVIYRDVTRYANAITIPGIVVFRFDSRIFFGNTEFLKNKMSAIVKMLEQQPLHKAVIIDASSITSVDSTGIEALREIVADTARKGIILCFANLDGLALQTLRVSKIVEQVGEEKLFWRVHDAVNAVTGREIKPHPLPHSEEHLYLLERAIKCVKQRRAQRKLERSMSQQPLSTASPVTPPQGLLEVQPETTV